MQDFKVFLACVVLYEQVIEKCITLHSLNRSLKKQFPLDVVLYDNSPVQQENTANIKALFDNLNIYYITDPSNPGVAKAYNEAAKIAEQAGKKWLFLFDQDTDINESFMEQVRVSIGQNPRINLFCPVIKSRDVIISPTFILTILQKTLIPTRFATGIQQSKNYTLINSGLVINCKEFKLLGGYDEELRLDFSDHYFFYKYKKRNIFFYIVPVINNHGFSTFFENDPQRTLKRFSTYYHASFIYSSKIKNLFPVFWAFLRGLKLVWQYQSFAFFKAFLKSKKLSS